jgi:F-type H+-transporting ATPase subunit delta
MRVEEGSMVSGGTSVTGVAGRYATALFELALEQDNLAEVEQQLSDLGEILDASDDLRRLVHSPAFSMDQQAKAVRAIADAAGTSGLTRNFLELLVEKRRLSAISGIIGAFRTLAARHRGEVEADVVSAVPLSDDQQEDLKTALRDFAGQDVSMNVRVDPSILGGLIVKVGSRMIDNSVRSKLNRLRHAMKEVG